MSEPKKTGNTGDVLLRVEHLCQYFGGLKAVNDVSFDIRRGEVFGLVGESGCGKTTTGRTIIKLYNATSGNVYFKGQRIVAGTLSYRDAIAAAKAKEKADLAALAEHRAEPDYAVKCAAVREVCRATVEEQRRLMKAAKYDHYHSDREYARTRLAALDEEFLPKIAAATDPEAAAALRAEYKKQRRIVSRTKLITKIQMIFQDPIASLDPRMTVREIISEGLRIQGVRDEHVIDEKVYEMLETVGLVREHAGRYPHEFSGGQRQRIGVARAIVMNPELIIADEPISALDVSIRAQVINLLNDLREKMGLTILFIAHDLSVVKYFSDRIGVMYFGNLVELADSDELFKYPLHPYTRSLLSAIPLPDPISERNRQRIVYDKLRDSDVTHEPPVMREIRPGHFVLCSEREFAKYKETVPMD